MEISGSRFGIRRALSGKFGLLLMALVALVIATPMILSDSVGVVALSLFTAAVLVASVHAARPGVRSLMLGVALALVDFTIGRCVAAFDLRWLIVLQSILWTSTLIYAASTILEAVFAARSVTIETLQAALCVYLMIGLIGAFGFTLLDLTIPGSFRVANGPIVNWSNGPSRAAEFVLLFDFSFATLSGSGYTEIAPSSGFAINAASLEAMTGQIYLAVVIARLVGLQISAPTR